jgi:hypothetical protein
MRKTIMKRLFLFISITIAVTITGCIKETYNMKLLSKQTQLSPTLAISAANGDVSFIDMVKVSDTVTVDQNNLVVLVFKKDSMINLKLSDFSKGPVVLKTANIDTTSFDLNIRDVLSHITGDILISNPSIKFNYTNSFSDSVKVNLIASGSRGSKSVDLNVAPFPLALPNIPVEQEISSIYIIDKSNSNLQSLVSLPPEVINFTGTVTLRTSAKSSQTDIFVLGSNQLLGSLELEIPLELKVNNLQYKDTVNNFLNDKGKDNPVSPEDFQFLRINFNAKNGFPLGASLKMELYDSLNSAIKSTVTADGILDPAPVDSNGKATGVTESSTTIEFTKEFFGQVNKADKIIFTFTLQSSGDGSKAVKIYSDYRISFNAALVVKPVINLN